MAIFRTTFFIYLLGVLGGLFLSQLNLHAKFDFHIGIGDTSAATTQAVARTKPPSVDPFDTSDDAQFLAPDAEPEASDEPAIHVASFQQLQHLAIHYHKTRMNLDRE